MAVVLSLLSLSSLILKTGNWGSWSLHFIDREGRRDDAGVHAHTTRGLSLSWRERERGGCKTFHLGLSGRAHLIKSLIWTAASFDTRFCWPEFWPVRPAHLLSFGASAVSVVVNCTLAKKMEDKSRIQKMMIWLGTLLCNLSTTHHSLVYDDIPLKLSLSASCKISTHK